MTAGSRPLPPDRSGVDTERPHPSGIALDELDTEALVDFLAQDQRRAVEAVVSASSELAGLVDVIVDSLSRGGRLIYLGAGTSGRLGVLDASE